MISPDFTQTDNFDRLAMICRALTGDLETTEVVEIVMQQSMAGTSASGASVAFRQGDQVILGMSAGSTTTSVRRLGPLALTDRNPVCQAIRTGQPVWLPHRELAIARFHHLRLASATTQGWAAVPLVSHGQPFGALSLSFPRPPLFDPVERRFILAVADVAALVLARRAPQRVEPVAPALPPLVEDLLLRPGDAALVIDEDGVIVAVNDGLPELTGRSRHDLVGRSVEGFLPDADQGDHAAWRRRYLDDPIPRPFGSGLDITLPLVDGSRLRVDIALTPLVAAHGAYVLAVIRPVS